MFVEVMQLKDGAKQVRYINTDRVDFIRPAGDFERLDALGTIERQDGTRGENPGLVNETVTYVKIGGAYMLVAANVHELAKKFKGPSISELAKEFEIEHKARGNG